MKGKQYDLPNGAVPRSFVHMLAEEIETLAKNNHPSERVLVFVSVMLQRDIMVKQARDIRLLLNQRLEMWKANEIDSLINGAIHSDKHLITRGGKNDMNHIIKVFRGLMVKGKVRDAMNWLVDNGQSSVGT